MSRKTEIIKIESNNRDNGKRFLITEMSAFKAEKLAMRIFLSAIKHGLDIDDNIAAGGLTALFSDEKQLYKLIGNIPFEEAEDLFDEMINCVKIMTHDNNNEVNRMLMDGDIEEVTTLLQLRMRIIELHINF